MLPAILVTRCVHCLTFGEVLVDLCSHAVKLVPGPTQEATPATKLKGLPFPLTDVWGIFPI